MGVFLRGLQDPEAACSPGASPAWRITTQSGGRASLLAERGRHDMGMQACTRTCMLVQKAPDPVPRDPCTIGVGYNILLAKY